MDMEFMDLYHRPYAGLDMQPPFHGQPQPGHGLPQTQPQYPFWNPHLMAFYQQQQHHQRAAVMMGQAGLHGSKQTEPKPRLAKDEVELLEREFAKNQKPNSNTKRELAEQMGVEVPRINNWFQNRRAKEKQLKKTAEFEAQQARQRASSEPKSGDEQEQGDISEFYGLRNHHQSLTMSTATFGESDSLNDESDGSESERQQSIARDQLDHVTPESLSPDEIAPSPAGVANSDHVSIDLGTCSPPVPSTHVLSEFLPDAVISRSFDQVQLQGDLEQPSAYTLGVSDRHMTNGNLPQDFEGLPAHCIALPPSATMETFPDTDFFDVASLAQFPSQLITEGITGNRQPLAHPEPAHTYVKTEGVSPHPMPESPPTPPEIRFKSPPPRADIASRRNMRCPAPLVSTALRGAPHCVGPKTGIDPPRRSETASPMRRISSVTSGVGGRVQKSFSNVGPRSPFTIERNKEALFQSLQTNRSPIMTSLNNALSPVTPDGMGGQGLREGALSTSPSDDDQAYTFGAMQAVGGFPMYKSEMNSKTPPDTPGLANTFPENFFPNATDQAWNFIPHDEPLPTPSLCSHGGSELEFSMAGQIPGYVASQPATPSFPPSIGPTYGGFFGNVANAEYNFPDSYPAESSARSSPGGPPKSKQFQFAQNVTPQDFNSER